MVEQAIDKFLENHFIYDLLLKKINLFTVYLLCSITMFLLLAVCFLCSQYIVSILSRVNQKFPDNKEITESSKKVKHKTISNLTFNLIVFGIFLILTLTSKVSSIVAKINLFTAVILLPLFIYGVADIVISAISISKATRRYLK